MTAEEAYMLIAERIRAELDENLPFPVELQVALEVLEKQNKYRWHDLRKDPNDLPDKSLFFKTLLCVNGNGEYLLDCDLHWDEMCDWFEAESEGVCLIDVIAWREIEEFEEV